MRIVNYMFGCQTNARRDEGVTPVYIVFVTVKVFKIFTGPIRRALARLNYSNVRRLCCLVKEQVWLIYLLTSFNYNVHCFSIQCIHSIPTQTLDVIHFVISQLHES